MVSSLSWFFLVLSLFPWAHLYWTILFRSVTVKLYGIFTVLWTAMPDFQVLTQPPLALSLPLLHLIILLLVTPWFFCLNLLWQNTSLLGLIVIILNRFNNSLVKRTVMIWLIDYAWSYFLCLTKPNLYCPPLFPVIINYLTYNLQVIILYNFCQERPRHTCVEVEIRKTVGEMWLWVDADIRSDTWYVERSRL